MENTFKALSDSTRRKILSLLKEGDMTAGEIADHFDISKPSISNHLNILKNANLVLWDKKGQNIYYSLNTTAFQDVMKFFLDLMKGDDDNEQNK